MNPKNHFTPSQEELNQMNKLIPFLPQEEDVDWACSHSKELSPFEGQWVAIYQKKIIGNDHDKEEARKKALQTLNQAISNLYLTFVTPSNCILVL